MAVVDPATHLFWVLSRGAGTTALILSSASVAFGLMMAGRVVKGSNPDRRAYHEALSLSVMVAIAVHGLTLIGDSFLHPSLLDVTVPFVFSYKTVPTSIGIISGWAVIFFGLSYYLRGRIGQARWKLIHRFTVLAWLAGLVHTFTEGTDRGQIWFIALIVASAAPAVVMLALRATGKRLKPVAARAAT
jgi:sulfoxide reductase heme-binding subunit YedZ